MKKISKILIILAGAVFFIGISSCDTEEFLEVDHYSILDADQMFKSDEDAKAGLVGCYDMMLPVGETNGDWGFKPNLFIGGHPTMDTQATGWDKDWNTQNWNPGSPELLSGWKHAYKAITRCNDFLSGLEEAENITPALKTSLDGQARGIRAFFYMWLAKAFGRVPMLATGENYVNTPAKARAETYEEMWNFIIEDLKVAVDELKWEPLNGEYGRITKGFALSYLGEAYMWMAFRVPDKATENYQLAAAALLEVINSGKYALNPSFTTLWDPGEVWTKECIWEEVLDEGSQWNSWSNLTDAHTWHTYFSACPSLGGWGSLYLSWEWWGSYEPGDKRREASGVTGEITDIKPEWKSATNYGYNPYLQQSLTVPDKLNTHYHFYMNGEAAPSIWSLKTWRTCRANWQAMWGPQQIYYKRYANVLFDYAECLFNLNGESDATAWGIINQIRERAWGNLEVGKKEELTAKYLPYYQQIAQFYISKGDENVVVPEEYPLPFNENTVVVPDAKTYYAQLKSDKGFSSPVWLLALGEERRKEFNTEWCLAQDLIRSGYIEDHITNNYPKGVGVPNTDPGVQDNWHTYRNFDFDIRKMDMPIPTDELLKNDLCDQNDAYK
ncbi:RagB/SusD family nutrient uptake outer membrane protein [Maribellus sediminis]|uniref:RagB/SusD family nutrient uptake outer membrane protein n=1 Tax=Maribellus sediminis TaxID=2696285 RepID=UPI0014313B5F|nr:RagB/SusD family nutrient uptake outer membrane protein [Maribellus sediminis]